MSSTPRSVLGRLVSLSGSPSYLQLAWPADRLWSFSSLGVFPRLIRSFGIPSLYRLFVSFWIFLWILPPVMRALIGTSLDGNVGDVPGPVVWSLMGIVLVLYALGDLSFPLGMMSLSDSLSCLPLKAIEC